MTSLPKAGRGCEGSSVGDGTDDGVTIGPLINEGAANDVMGFIDDAVGKGARVIGGWTAIRSRWQLC